MEFIEGVKSMLAFCKSYARYGQPVERGKACDDNSFMRCAPTRRAAQIGSTLSVLYDVEMMRPRTDITKYEMRTSSCEARMSSDKSR
jgi:hypothetical protein